MFLDIVIGLTLIVYTAGACSTAKLLWASMWKQTHRQRLWGLYGLKVMLWPIWLTFGWLDKALFED